MWPTVCDKPRVEPEWGEVFRLKQRNRSKTLFLRRGGGDLPIIESRDVPFTPVYHSRAKILVCSSEEKKTRRKKGYDFSTVHFQQIEEGGRPHIVSSTPSSFFVSSFPFIHRKRRMVDSNKSFLFERNLLDCSMNEPFPMPELHSPCIDSTDHDNLLLLQRMV